MEIIWVKRNQTEITNDFVTEVYYRTPREKEERFERFEKHITSLAQRHDRMTEFHLHQKQSS